MIRPVPILAALLVAGCAGQPEGSLGDSPIRDVRCPTFLDDTGCLARAKRECGTESITVVREPQEEERIGRGTTVPIEGKIEYRTLRVLCEE